MKLREFDHRIKQLKSFIFTSKFILLTRSGMFYTYSKQLPRPDQVKKSTPGFFKTISGQIITPHKLIQVIN